MTAVDTVELFHSLEQLRHEFLAVSAGASSTLAAKLDALAADTSAIRQHLDVMNGRLRKNEIAVGRLKLVAGVIGGVSLTALGALLQFAPRLLAALARP